MDQEHPRLSGRRDAALLKPHLDEGHASGPHGWLTSGSRGLSWLGVVGEQPHLLPGEDFHYTSGAVLETAVGTMRGSYQMLADDGHRFDAAIAQFTLSIPRTVH